MNTNVVVLAGHLCADPELRSVGQGKSVCDLRLAVNCDYGSGDNRREETCFIDVVAWERLAENCNEDLRRGDKMIVQGNLKYEEWEDKETGKKRSKHRVTARTIEFPSKKESGRDGGGDDRRQEPRRDERPASGGERRQEQKPRGEEVDFSDIPFAWFVPLMIALLPILA